jgi:hypothetical protein
MGGGQTILSQFSRSGEKKPFGRRADFKTERGLGPQPASGRLSPVLRRFICIDHKAHVVVAASHNHF